MRWLRDLLYIPSVGLPPPLPKVSAPVCVIGDIHGRLDLLDGMLDLIAHRSDQLPVQIVVVGDMIDRGPDSAGVLKRLFDLYQNAPNRIICLMGNHERMLLDFLDDPTVHGPRWIASGGAETLISFGLSPWARRPAGQDAMKAIATELRAALSPDVLLWLTALPLIWQDGTLAVTHAGADPSQSMATQSEHRLLWGTRGREAKRRADNIWVVHGHTVVKIADTIGARISIDTGAWLTGRLTAAWIDDNGLSFITKTSEV